METKLDSRQGQFPASFPDTFKDFFAMMSEDEDHLDLFSNLLEDKMIPRTNRHNQRKCGGSLRCPSTNNSNVGRSNSFRLNRPSSSYCKHIKYCCLHQKQYSQNFIDFGYSSPNDDDDGETSEVKQKSKNIARTQIMDRNYDCDNYMSTSSSAATIPYISVARHPKRQNQHQLHHRHQNKNQPQLQEKSNSEGFHLKDDFPRIAQQCGLRDSMSDIASSSGSSLNPEVGSLSAAVSNCNVNSEGRPISTLYSDRNTSSISSSKGIMTKCFSDKLTPSTPSRPSTLRGKKSPVFNRRRSSSIAATLLSSDNKIFRNADDSSPWGHTITHSNTREILSHVKSPVNSIGVHPPMATKGKISVLESGVLSFKQAISGAVSPQLTPSLSSVKGLHCAGGSSSNSAITVTTGVTSTSTATSRAVTPTSIAPTPVSKTEFILSGSVAAIQQISSKTKQRLRTSSMPAESRKPRLADTRRAAIHCADMDIEYYRLRSFSITSHGICNLGDSMRSRRSRSINSVTSTGTSNSGRDRNNSNASADVDNDLGDSSGVGSVPAYKIAILGASGVGKTALTYQFTTSDYICAYDLSLDDDYGQKTVSVLLDGIETDLEIIDHPASEMSTEAFCSTYNVDLFVVVYSVVDRNSFKSAEKILQYLKESEMLLTRGAILVGNKTDLERHREVSRQAGRNLAREICCKFIETSSGLDHNVNELLVGIVAQVKLNPQRINNLTEKERQRVSFHSTLQKHRRIEFPSRKIIKQMSVCKDNENKMTATVTTPTIHSNLNIRPGPMKKISKRALNLESILKVSESEVDDEDDDGYKPDFPRRERTREMKKAEGENSNSSSNSPKLRNSYENSQNMTNLVDDSKERSISKFSNRTRIFLTSVLKFKKNLNVKRRNSNSCSDLFVI